MKKKFWFFRKNKDNNYLEETLEVLRIEIFSRNINLNISNIRITGNNLKFEIIRKEQFVMANAVSIDISNLKVKEIIAEIEKEILKERIRDVIGIYIENLLSKVRERNLNLESLKYGFEKDTLKINGTFRELINRKILFFSGNICKFKFNKNSDKEDLKNLSYFISLDIKKIENIFNTERKKEIDYYMIKPEIKVEDKEVEKEEEVKGPVEEKKGFFCFFKTKKKKKENKTKKITKEDIMEWDKQVNEISKDL